MSGPTSSQPKNFSHMLPVVSGRRRDLAAIVMRMGLSLLAIFYRLIIWGRNKGFQWGVLKTSRVTAKVISVGNLTTGGTGKTPFVIWLVRWLGSVEESPQSDYLISKMQVGIISRGYGSIEGGPNDEALEIEQRLPGVCHLQGRRRFESAQKAQSQGCDVLLLDDGFQHRQLARDLDIVLVDATNPFGYGHLLPRGLLREPVSSIARADAAVLTRTNGVSNGDLMAIRQRLQKYNPHLVFAHALTRPIHLLNHSGESAPLSSVDGKQCIAFCGIGNPDAFRRSLGESGIEPVAFLTFPDHHHYSFSDLKQIATTAKKHGCEEVLCTHKDLVKVASDQLESIPLWALSSEMEFTRGEAELAALVLGTLARSRR